jgi:hypothetical protein
MESNITKSEMRLSRTSDVGLAHAAVYSHQAEVVTCPTKPRVTPEQRKTPVGKTPVGKIALDWPKSISKQRLSLYCFGKMRLGSQRKSWTAGGLINRNNQRELRYCMNGLDLVLSQGLLYDRRDGITVRKKLLFPI